jgi:hypothetical protein
VRDTAEDREIIAVFLEELEIRRCVVAGALGKMFSNNPDCYRWRTSCAAGELCGSLRCANGIIESRKEG